MLYGYNTDGIYIMKSEKRFKNKMPFKFSTKQIGNAYETNFKPTYF